MNFRTSYALLAILTAVGTLVVSSAYAQACPDCDGEGKSMAEQLLLSEVPISVWTDRTVYDHEDVIKVEGRVANIASGFPVTVTVISPTNNVVTIAQIDVNRDNSFGTMLSTGGALWKQNGTYTIKVQYGNSEKSNKVLVELTGEPVGAASSCGVSELSANGHCIPYSITGAKVTGASINSDNKSVVVKIKSTEDGTLTLSPSKSILDGIFMVLVDGEEWNDVEINGNEVTVSFLAGAEKIEVIGTFVIPEFGTIAALILVVAIASIIAVTARSRLGIMPKY